MRARFLITTICALLVGALAGFWVVSSTPDEPKENQTNAAAEQVTAEHEQLSPVFDFADARAAHVWMVERVNSGSGAELEALFRPGAGLTEALRVELARSLLTHNYRRMDPHALGRILLRLPPGREADRSLNELFWKWASDDADECLRFLENLSPEQLNSLVLNNAGLGLALLPAERLIAFARRLDDRGRAFLAEGLAGSVDECGSWVNTSAVLARMEFKSDKNAIPMEQVLASNMVRIAPGEIEAKIAAETDPRKRDRWLEGYAWVIGRENPAVGLPIDARIENVEIRKTHHQHHITRWLKSDRAAAVSWLQSDDARLQMDARQRRGFLASYGLEAPP